MESLANNDEQAVSGTDLATDAVAADDGDLVVANKREFFHGAEEICEALQRLTSADLEPRACREACERVGTVWAQYQEQPGLLDPFLEGMVNPLTEAIRAAVHANSGAPASVLPNLHMMCSLLYLLTTVRGYKTVSRFFPHEAADLEPALEAAEAEAAAAQADTWSTLYCLTLWLGMVLLTPFDLQSIDSGGTKHLSARIRDLGLRGLRNTSRNREASAWMLAKYFMRRDVAAEGALQEFLRWTRDAWSPNSESTPATGLSFVRCGSLQAWNQTLKVAQRAQLQGVWAQVVDLMKAGPSSAGDADFGASSALRKLRVAVACRAALSALPPRLASWRYERGARSLLVNFAQAAGASRPEVLGGTEKQQQREQEQEQEDDDDVPEQVEEVVDLLLNALSDADTVVRWAAAKGIGRVSNRLSRDFGNQVLEALLEQCFSFRADDKAWHGGCLALAELARRGLLLPERLPEVMPLVCQALHFERVTGAHAVGQHVRDAACYVCWAFARAYAPEALAGFVTDLAQVLIQVAVYDREINCRRAAAAAVQEHVGRQGTFPHGIDVVTIADYWTLSVRRSAYLVVAPQVAALGNYRRGLIDCLVDRKLQHQDAQIRLLACQALAKLAEEPSEETLAYLNESILPQLTSRALSADAPGGTATAVGVVNAGIVPMRHGAVAGAAALVRTVQGQVSAENQNALRNLVPSLEKARAYRGRGGEVVRQAACELIGRMAATVSWPFKDTTCSRYLQTLEENLRHTTDAIQVAAVDALEAMVRHRFKAELSAKCLETCVSSLQKPTETIAARRGCVLALGVLPPALRKERISFLCKELIGEKLPGGKEHEDPQTRQYAVLSLGRTCLGADLDNEALATVVAALEAAMADYAVDRRGDVGSWVREAAMEVIVALLDAQKRGARPTLANHRQTTRLVALVLRQSVEKLDRLRESAFSLLRRLLRAGASCAPFNVELAYRRVCHNEQYECTELGEAALVASEAILAWPPAHCDELAAALGGPDPRAASAAGGPATSPELICFEGCGGRTDVEQQLPPDRRHNTIAAYMTLEEQNLKIFDAMAPMLAFEAYRSELMLGFVVSVGGITEHTTKAAKKALLQYLQDRRPGDGTSRVLEVCNELLQMFSRFSMLDTVSEAKRLLVPLLNTLNMLLGQDCFPAELAPLLFERALGAIRRSRDIGRLKASIPVFVGLLRWPGSVRRQALSVLLQFLGYSFPIVRQSTAQALYIRFLEESGGLDLSTEEDAASPARGCSAVAASALAEVLELLTVTPWGTDKEDVLAAALGLVYEKLGCERPTSGPSLLIAKDAQAERRAAKPEYATLVHENHY